MTKNSDLLNTKETALYLGVTVGTLAVWRTNKTYPIPYTKSGGSVKYSQNDLDKWLESRTVYPVGYDKD